MLLIFSSAQGFASTAFLCKVPMSVIWILCVHCNIYLSLNGAMALLNTISIFCINCLFLCLVSPSPIVHSAWTWYSTHSHLLQCSHSSKWPKQRKKKMAWMPKVSLSMSIQGLWSKQLHSTQAKHNRTFHRLGHTFLPASKWLSCTEKKKGLFYYPRNAPNTQLTSG